MQLLLNAIIWDLSWVLHKNWNTQTATRFGWLLGSSWFLLGKAGRADSPSPAPSHPGDIHSQKKAGESSTFHPKKLPGVTGLRAFTFDPRFQTFLHHFRAESLSDKKKKIKKAMANCLLLNLVIKPTPSRPCFVVICQHFWFNLYYLILVCVSPPVAMESKKGNFKIEQSVSA